MSREASLQELMVASFESQINNLFTSIPCIVVAVDLAKSTVDIQPTINQKLKDGSIMERPVIMGIPISFPVSSTAGFTFPIEVGTTGLATFSMRDMEGWMVGNGRPTTPLNSGKMDENDAIFVPGIQPPGVTVNNPAKRILQHNVKDTVVVNNIGTTAEVEVRLKANGSIVLNAPLQTVEVNCKNSVINASESANIISQQITLDASDIQVYGNITHIGNYTATGSMTFNGIDFSSHRHTGVDSGPDTSGGPVN